MNNSTAAAAMRRTQNYYLYTATEQLEPDDVEHAAKPKVSAKSKSIA